MLYTMGHEMYGRLGIGVYPGESTFNFYGTTFRPYKVNSEIMFKTAAASQSNGCAIDMDDELWCWGRNDSGTDGNIGTGFRGGEDGLYGYYSPIKIDAGKTYSKILGESNYFFCF